MVQRALSMGKILARPAINLEIEAGKKPSRKPASKSTRPKARPYSSLKWALEHAIPSAMPADFSAEHNHYLYGTPKTRNSQ